MSFGDSPTGSNGIVLDVGTLDTKAGFAGEAFPRCIVPTVAGRFRRPSLTDGFPDIYFGKEAVRNRGLSNITRLVEDGLICSWNEIERFWHHLFYKELYVAPEQAQLLYSIHPLTPRRHKEQMTEILFESFMIHGLYLAISSVLSLHATGRTSGVVWENGYSCCYASAVFEGFPLKHTCVTSKINGHVLTDYLGELLKKKGYLFTTAVEKDILDKIKAKLCYVTKDYIEEIALQSKGDSYVSYNLPDGQQIQLHEERFLCPELLFQPSLQDKKHPNIVDDLYRTITKCDLDYKSLFLNNIVISGGSSMFPGLPERLRVELLRRVIDAPGVKVNVDALSSRSVAAWAGGSILASLTTMNNFWMTREEYEDVGLNCVNYKFY